MSVLSNEHGALVRRRFDETVCIEPWGENSFRVRATKNNAFLDEQWALMEACGEAATVIRIDGNAGAITNGKLTASINARGKITFTNQKGEVLLEEYWRNRDMHHEHEEAQFNSALDVEGREFTPHPGGDWALTARFESNPDEKLFGMGQYQQPMLNLKGCTIELAQRNSQASVPFMLSSLGYGLLWNNPAIGKAAFSLNYTEWQAHYTKQLDYWITAGDSPTQIEEAYTGVTGRAPMMPDYAMGYWQCKLRYQTQEELMAVARGYKERGLPVSVIVVDYFHWPRQGDWRFDTDYWPDPAGMVRELREMGIELMVSVWPTVDHESENFKEMLDRGYLVRTERGIHITMNYYGNTVFYDTTHPGAREFVWQIIKKNYYDLGIKIFWLDEAEPEYRIYDFDQYRYYLGPNMQIGNLYPKTFAQGFYEGMRGEGQQNPLNLLRCAWAGSQRYGALVWSGDIDSSFASMRNQLSAGLNMSIAGIHWWTTDIGGFHGGDIREPAFHEVLIRWFQWGAFCPVMRMHGFREPQKEPLDPDGVFGGGVCKSGSKNEIWSYGAENEKIMAYYIRLRERLRPYVKGLMKQVHEKGSPAMLPLFYDFPGDKAAWDIDDSYMFGPDLLVSPVIGAGLTERPVYLPAGAKWRCAWTDEEFEGGRTVIAKCPIHRIPLFLRDGADLPIRE